MNPTDQESRHPAHEQPPPVTADQLRQFVERQHGGKAKLVTKLTVRQFVNGQAVLAEVYIFDLQGNAKSTRAYAFASPIEDTERCEFHARLHLGAVQSPVDAVRAWAEQSASPDRLCETCRGSGQVRPDDKRPPHPCVACNGTGERDGGSGRVVVFDPKRPKRAGR